MDKQSPARSVVAIDDDTDRLLREISAHENRPVGEVVADAVLAYLRTRSQGYRRYLSLAGRLLDPTSSDEEKAQLREELATSLTTADRQAPARGGSVSAVRARLRQRQVERSSPISERDGG